MTELVALVLSLAWLGLMAWFFLTVAPEGALSSSVMPEGGRLAGSAPLSFLLTLLAVVLPVALFWIAAAAARLSRTTRREAARLEAAVDSLRMAYAESQDRIGTSLRLEVEARMDGVARAQAALGAEVAALAQAGAPDAGDAPGAVPLDPPRRPMPPAAQRVLDLTGGDGVADAADGLTAADVIRALDFPENERDEEGFRVLRAALEHPPTAELVQASQDVLTLLAQDGIYVDDLTCQRAAASVWRAFAAGVRGDAVAALAGVRDRSSVALATARMREDPVFRDAVHQFVRTFDRRFRDFVETASDAEVARLGDTRTGRAFMLLGQVTGTFG